MIVHACGKVLFRPQIVNHIKRKMTHMGDKSPKAIQKKTHQKQSKQEAVAAQKRAVTASKQQAASTK